MTIDHPKVSDSIISGVRVATFDDPFPEEIPPAVADELSRLWRANQAMGQSLERITQEFGDTPPRPHGRDDRGRRAPQGRVAGLESARAAPQAMGDGEPEPSAERHAAGLADQARSPARTA